MRLPGLQVHMGKDAFTLLHIPDVDMQRPFYVNINWGLHFYKALHVSLHTPI